MMPKEINEKTFESNLTRELLEVSKSYIYYMTNPYISTIMSQDEWFEFLLNNKFFSVGLTQAQEANPTTGGYDISINYMDNNGCTGRLLFLQYKSGKRASFCKNLSSQFHGSRTNQNPHVVFTFNDAADKTQHSTLRNLANRPSIRAESVLYVFPRVTEYSDFLKSCNDLLNRTSFVPILEIDRQGLAQTPPLAIIDGVPHKYRTSYDGNTSEVNYYYYAYDYEQRIISDLISELVCIQLERFFIKLKNNKNIIIPDIKYLIENLKENIRSRNDKIFRGVNISGEKIIDYLNKFNITGMNSNDLIVPKAPQNLSTEIPFDGLKLELERDSNYSQINYQII